MIRIGRGAGPYLAVGMLPGRKRPSLYWWTALEIRPIATFVNVQAAEDVAKFFEDLVGARITMDAEGEA